MKILALYDFASKQNYIFRTSKVKEIVGASKLLAGMYVKFVEWLRESGVIVLYDLQKPFSLDVFEADAEVIYDGGGNLMIMFKDHDTYVKANKIVSKKLLTEAPTLNMIVSCVEVNEVSPDFSKDSKKLYEENSRFKNLNPSTDISAVTPFTQVDPMTFRPVTYKGNRYTVEDMSFSSDRVAKQKAYSIDKTDFDEFDKGLVAVIHMDGNSMGNKLKSISTTNTDYETEIMHLRQFSAGVEKAFVEEPKAVLDKLWENYDMKYRLVIAGGDDLTFICNAEDALDIVKAYFDSLEHSECVVPKECREYLSEDDRKNTACAGIAVIHAKSPFSLAYEIAESACESAKVKAHEKPGNYCDFYYCHSGVTADFDTLRESEQSMTGRPYSYEDIRDKFEKYAAILRSAGRANVKALGSAAQLGEEHFRMEIERVNAYLGKEDALTVEDIKIVYDLSEFYDLWFCEK